MSYILLELKMTYQLVRNNWVSQIDIQKGILRSASDLKTVYEENSEKVGTLFKTNMKLKEYFL